jgi:hypothetical protein
MKKPNITPGRWNVVHMGREIYIETEAKEAADLETAENDAKIIAAAPAMAEALEAALVGLESDILYCERHPDSHSTTHEGMLAHKRKRLNDAKAALTLAGYEF